MNGNRLRIGVTQRRLPPASTTGERDALDSAWIDWFAGWLPAACFVAIPNFANAALALRFCKDWQLNAFVLSGGEDVGSSAARDGVETAVLDHAKVERFPVLGICRGMQMLHVWSGGCLERHPGHAGTAHWITAGGQRLFVNSWHNFAVREAPSGWRGFAHADDGTIEAMRHEQLGWLALMWHPERTQGDSPIVRELVDGLFETHGRPG